MADDEIWKTISKPQLLQTAEGESVSCEIVVGGGNPEKLPEVKWIKGKWNELSGNRYIFESNVETMEFKLTFKNPKLHDAGNYTIKVISEAGEHCSTFELKIGAALKSDKAKKIAALGAGGKDQETDEAFKKRIAKMKKSAKAKPKLGDDVWDELKIASPKDYEEIAFRHGITDLRGMLKRLAQIKKKKKLDEKAEKDKLDENDLKHPVLKKARRRGTLTKDDEKKLPFDIKLKCGKAAKSNSKDGAVDFRSLLKHVKAFSIKLPPTASFIVGDRIELTCSTSNEVMNGKWQKNGKDITSSGHIKLMNQGSKRKFVIESCLLHDDCKIGYVVGEEKTECEVFVKDRPVTILKGFEDTQIIDGEDVHMKAELSLELGAFKIFFDGQELKRTPQIQITQRHTLIDLRMKACSFDRAGFYSIKTNGDESMAELIVDEKPWEFHSQFQDLTVLEDEQAIFECDVSVEKARGVWLKDQKPIHETDILSGRIRFVEEGVRRGIIINECRLTDIGEYEYRIKLDDPDVPPLSMTACLNVVELIIIKPKEPPQLKLNLAAQGNITLRAGSKLSIDVTIQHNRDTNNHKNPVFAPDFLTENSRRIQGGVLFLEEDAKIRWTRKQELHGDANGDGIVEDDEYFEAVDIKDESDKVRVDRAPDKTTMVLMKSDRGDTGLYRLHVKTEEGEDSAVFKVTVIDRPGRPSQPEISELTGEDCQIDWTPPEDDGGCQIRGYIIERKKTSSTRWIKLNASLHEYHNYWARRMIEGNEYEVRVTAVNEVGPGRPSKSSKKFTPQQPTTEVTCFRTGEITDNTIELLWGAPLEIGYAGLTGYRMEYQMLECNPRDCDPFAMNKSNWTDAKDGDLISPLNFKINMEKLATGRNYMFRICTVNDAGRSKWVYLGPILCASCVIDPKIVLPKEYKKVVRVVKGEPLHLVVPFEGRPLPSITWAKKETPREGWNFLEPTFTPLPDKATVNNSAVSTIMHIKEADMTDSGEYRIEVVVGEFDAEAVVTVEVIDKPSCVRNLKVAEIIGNSVSLTWNAPFDEGNCEMLGYRVERRDKKFGNTISMRPGNNAQWYVVYDRVRQTQAMVYDLVQNNAFQFRVFPVNECGIGEPMKTFGFVEIHKDTFDPVLREFEPREASEKPTFQTPLNSRGLITGYGRYATIDEDGTLSCSVRGNPFPKITWYYNKVPIPLDNPKYRQMRHNGLCQLEIRKARLGDGGEYMCHAENDLGQDWVIAETTVRDPEERGARRQRELMDQNKICAVAN